MIETFSDGTPLLPGFVLSKTPVVEEQWCVSSRTLVTFVDYSPGFLSLILLLDGLQIRLECGTSQVRRKMAISRDLQSQ